RCMVGGDENSAKDVGLAIAALDRIRTALACTAYVVHHTGKNTEIERGSSALRAAADTMMGVSKDGTTITLRCEKQKNAAPFEDVTVRLRPVTLEDGTTSCVVEPAQAGATLTGTALKALRVLAEIFDEDGATFSAWLRNSGIPETTFRREKKTLVKGGYVQA